MTGATKLNSERTFQIKCEKCGETIGFLTTKYYMQVRLECKKCYIDRIKNE